MKNQRSSIFKYLASSVIAYLMMCVFLIGMPVAQADGYKETFSYRGEDGLVHSITFSYGSAVWYISEEVSDSLDGAVYDRQIIAWGSVDNPNPDDPSSGTGPDIIENIKTALEKGDITIIPKESPVNSELFDVLGESGFDTPDKIWNSEDEKSGAGIIVIVGDRNFEKFRMWLEETLAGMPGSSTGYAGLDENNNLVPGYTPTGGTGNTGGGSGDGSGDASTRTEGNDTGFSGGDGDYDTIIHPQANPAP